MFPEKNHVIGYFNWLATVNDRWNRTNEFGGTRIGNCCRVVSDNHNGCRDGHVKNTVVAAFVYARLYFKRG